MGEQIRRGERFTRTLVAYTDQLDWVAEHGDSEAGYVLRYGDNGRAIYRADADRLAVLHKAIR